MTRAPYEPPSIQPHRPDLVNQFGRAAAHPVTSEIDGVAISELAERFGSPLFVFSEKTLRARIAGFRQTFRKRYPNIRFAWSYKTNYLDAICAIFHQEGWDAEVVSELEYDMARRLGVPGDRVICNGAYKPLSWCTRAAAENALIQIDHFDEIELLSTVVKPRSKPLDVGLRVNIRVDYMGSPWERFGFALENGEALDAVLRVAEVPRMRVVGLHCHLGTFITQPEAYRLAAQKLCAFARQIEPVIGQAVKYINLGGGLPSNNTLVTAYGEAFVPSLEDFAEAICWPLKEAFSSHPHASSNGDSNGLPALILESGRALVDSSGSLIATVAGTRRLASGERGIVLDAGVNVLYTSHWYAHSVVSAQEVVGQIEGTTLHGPLCMNIDTLRRSVQLPPLEAGDHVVISPVGAYNVTQWMQFSQLRPPIVLIGEDGKPELIRRAETIDDVKGPETLPERLKRKKARDA
jgi:diaminopimelate decarboxylase